MAGNIDKGFVSKIMGPNDWGGHPTRAQINPATNSGAVTPALTIPWYLRGKIGNLKVGDCVAYALFDDGTGIIVDRLDGEWTGVIDYDTTVTGDTVHEKTVLTHGTTTSQGLITGNNGMQVQGGTGASIACSGNMAVTGGDVSADGISLKGHTHSCPQGGETSAAH